MFGGDEVGALVFDIGALSARVGYAGEDTPKSVFPSIVGTHPLGKETDGAAAMDTSGGTAASGTASEPPFLKGPRGAKVFVGTTSISIPRPDIQLSGPMKDGVVEDWDRFELLSDYAFNTGLRLDASQHPVLMVEPAWNPRSAREKMTELYFEKFNVPAFYLARAPVLTAFASGRHTSLVLDVGASLSSAVPVVDGFVINKGISKSRIAGDFLVEQSMAFLENDVKLTIHPNWMVAKRDLCSPGEKPRWLAKKYSFDPSESYKRFMKQILVQDFNQTVLCCTPRAYDKDIVSGYTSVPYDFPDGFNNNFGSDRFRIAETLFDPEKYAVSTRGVTVTQARGQTTDPLPTVALPKLVAQAIDLCDTDLKATLYSSVIVAGGASLTYKFPERLESDLKLLSPSMSKLKVVCSSLSVERLFSSWIGGSILASLGSFHQLWMSKQEYEESGKAYIEKKCA